MRRLARLVASSPAALILIMADKVRNMASSQPSQLCSQSQLLKLRTWCRYRLNIDPPGVQRKTWTGLCHWIEAYPVSCDTGLTLMQNVLGITIHGGWPSAKMVWVRSNNHPIKPWVRHLLLLSNSNIYARDLNVMGLK